MERLSQYGKPSKKSQAAPAAKAKKSDERKGDEAREPKDAIADAAEAA
jgi:hypothetical protein